MFIVRWFCSGDGTSMNEVYSWLHALWVLIALTATESPKRPAHILQPILVTPLNTTFRFTVESHSGQSLSLCLWERNFRGQRQMIVFDGQVGKGSENSSIAGVSFVDNDGGMKSGKCGLKVKAFTEQDFNTSWTCTLVAEDGTILTFSISVWVFENWVITPNLL